jgi:hypothetical protein
MDLLELAFYLSVLSYVTGLLLKALPLPFLLVKKIGRSLVSDGLFSAMLVFSYRVLLELIDYIGGLLGSNWAIYTAWILDKIQALLILLVLLKTIGFALSKAGFSFLAGGFLSQLTSLISTSLTTLIISTYISTMLYAGAPVLIALGLVLHAVPFRLTRSVGATLIAIVIVFSIGIPLMPAFINTFSSLVGYAVITRGDVCTGEIKIIDDVGRGLGYAIVEGYVSGELQYRYVVSGNGTLYVDSLYGLPCVDHEVVVNIADLYYTASVTRGESRNWDLTLVATNTLSIAPNRFVLFTSSYNLASYSSDNKWLNITMSSQGTNFTLYTERGDSVEVYVDGLMVEPTTTNQVEWYGVNLTTRTYTLNEGEHMVNIRVDWRGSSSPQPDPYPYSMNVLGVDLMKPETLIFIVTYLFFELTIMPIAYIAILFTISLSLARLLGGVSMSIARLVMV